MAKLAFGDNVQPLSFYEPLVPQPSKSGIATGSEEIIPLANNLVPTNTNANNNKGELSGVTELATSAVH